MGRAELLSAIFFILSFASYRKSKLHENCICKLRVTGKCQYCNKPCHSLCSTVRGGAWLLGSLLLAVASMLSKEQGITVVAVCIACDFLYNFQVYTSNPSVKILVLNIVPNFQGKQTIIIEATRHRVN